MARLPYPSGRLAVFTASQGDRVAQHLQSGVRVMLIAATLLLIINTATAAGDPTCTSNKVDECYLPQSENNSGNVGSYFSVYDASVDISSDGVSITLKKGSPTPNWPKLKLLVPENYNMTVSPNIPEDGTVTKNKFWYRIEKFEWLVTREDDPKDRVYRISLSCDPSVKITLTPPEKPLPVTFRFLTDGSIKYDSRSAAGSLSASCIPIERHADPAITGKTVITLQPVATGEFKVPDGSYVTLNLPDAMIMLDKALRPTTVAPQTTPNATTTNSSSTADTTSPTKETDGASTEPWIIAAAVVGSLLFLAALIGLAVFFIVIRPRMRAKKGAMEQSSGYAESSAKPTKKKRAKKGNKTSKKDADGSKKTKRTTKEGKPEQENTPSLNTRPEDAPPPPNGYPEPHAADPIAPAPAGAPAPGADQAYENLGPMPPPQQPVENLAP
ncbi:hypothetical protein AAVH_05705 [Aphelenchoides avenae]|nr:hypothetical protein AAVH_05705 [Aphelenchus avenae]